MTDQLTTAAVLAEALRETAVTHVFAYPGDPIIEFMEQSRQRELDVVLARREGTAAFMAEGLAMSTGRLGVCLSTLGPGSSALVNGVAAANLDRVPMLAISGQIESSREPYFTHQVLDHTQLFGSITKWAGRLEANAAGTTLRKAVSTAMAERPGAVHLTIAGDASEQIATDASFTPPPTAIDLTARVLRTDGAPDPLALIAGARRPVVLAGVGAVRAGASADLVAFAEKVGAPVVVSPMAKGIFPEDHPWFAGVLDMACNDVVWEFLAGADLIVTAGFDGVELIKPWQLDVPVLHVDALQNTDQIYLAAVECLGHIGAIFSWFSEEWSGEPRWSQESVAAHRSRLREAYYAGRVEGALNPTDVVDVVRAAMPEDTIATCDVGSHKLLVGQGWRTDRPRSVLMSNGLSSMGFGVPAAIAAQIAHPERRVVALVGDGGFAMTATELRLAAARRLPVVFVVFVDGSLNRIELKQQVRSYPSTATRIEDTDLVLLAESMGCAGERATTIAELERALAGSSGSSGPLLIEARIDPSQYESQF